MCQACPLWCRQSSGAYLLTLYYASQLGYLEWVLATIIACAIHDAYVCWQEHEKEVRRHLRKLEEYDRDLELLESMIRQVSEMGFISASKLGYKTCVSYIIQNLLPPRNLLQCKHSCELLL